MKYLFACFLFLMTFSVLAQSSSEQDKYIARMKATAAAPEGLVSSRSAVLFSSDYTIEDLEKIQKAFQQTGIDAVTYIQSDLVLAGADIKSSYGVRFAKRNIKFIFFARKQKLEYEFWCMTFNPKNGWNNVGTAWMVHAPRLPDLLTTIFRSLAGSQKRQNFLINDFPEMESTSTVFVNTRNENMISNLKSFRVALPGLGDPNSDKEILDYFTANFHGKFESAPDTVTDRELVQKGVRYVLRFVHAPDAAAKEIMGYEVNKSESAISSATYVDGNIQLKLIPSSSLIYKFYLKDLEDRNVYLGPKWDADVTWQEALKNHFDAYRVTGRLN